VRIVSRKGQIFQMFYFHASKISAKFREIFMTAYACMPIDRGGVGSESGYDTGRRMLAAVVRR